jgi:asparagine synthase (glutamine-hydrolysing)
MCGIFGFSGPAAPELLATMGALLRHRGPDDQGAFSTPDISLGADRLSVVGVANGTQPITNEDGSVVLVFNGEIYNFQALRARLEKRGHRFATETDGEVIVHLYEEEGDLAVSHLEGMFAWALWDERRKRLVLARDPMGIKPLYYMQHEHRFFFASEAKALLTVPGFERRVNLTAFDGLLRRGLAPDDHTLFAGIRTVPPGHLLRWAEGGAELAAYWRLEVRQAGEPQDPVGELRNRLADSVRRHLVSDVRVGACLSGGLDSSLLVAMMSRITGSPVKTFSVGFEEEFDERPAARLVAEYCGTDHHEVTLTGRALIDRLPFLLWHVEEPRLGPILPQQVLFERVGQEVKVALVGEGADELFGGYGRFKTTLGPLAYLPRAWGQTAYLGARHGGRRGQFPFLSSVEAQLEPELTERSLNAVFRHRGPARAEALLAYEQAEKLPKSNLLQVDRLSMAHSVEARVPYLDAGLVAFANRLPLHWKSRWRGEKRILREVARPLLPKSIWSRPKKGLANPLRAWVNSGLLDLARDYLAPTVVGGRGYFRVPSVQKLLRRVEQRQFLPYHLHQLYLLVLVEAWHRVFIDPPANVLRSPPAPVSEVA